MKVPSGSVLGSGRTLEKPSKVEMGEPRVKVQEQRCAWGARGGPAVAGPVNAGPSSRAHWSCPALHKLKAI